MSSSACMRSWQGCQMLLSLHFVCQSGSIVAFQRALNLIGLNIMRFVWDSLPSFMALQGPQMKSTGLHTSSCKEDLGAVWTTFRALELQCSFLRKPFFSLPSLLPLASEGLCQAFNHCAIFSWGLWEEVEDAHSGHCCTNAFVNFCPV